MIPLPKYDRSTMDYWVSDMRQDQVVQYVLNSVPFGRLKRVSFLGALDHIAPTRKLRKAPRTRAHHSLHVAALANYVATQRGYHDDLKRHLVVAGLLHDIGHPPLSHSVEPYFKSLFGFGHHEMGQAIIRGKQSSSKKFHNYLNNHVDIDFIAELIEGRVSDDEGGDIFSSPINIDTIEGIIRTYHYFSDASTGMNPIQVTKASFVGTDESHYRILDDFWCLKDFVYSRLINDRVGLMADKFSQAYFLESSEKLNEPELYEDEVKWNRKFYQLFAKLGEMASGSYMPDELHGMSVDFIKRKYVIEHGERGRSRYKCLKENGVYSFPSFVCQRTEQLRLV